MLVSKVCLKKKDKKDNILKRKVELQQRQMKKSRICIQSNV